jgi:D-3-phosphoglycerate dehydrogenase
MYEIVKLNKISGVINDIFTDKYSVGETNENPDGIILRSFNMASYQTGSKLKAVARAGAGVNNIPVTEMTEKGIVVFNTPGANANAVKELVILAMLMASRDILGGTKWVNNLTCDVEKTTEKGKSAFGGHEIFGKTVGIIGLGAIGVLVANACVNLGMKAIGYDMFLTEQNKAKLDERVKIVTLEEIYANSDIITVHVPLTDTTKKMINADSIAKMKDGVIIINMSRAALICVCDLKDAIKSGKVGKYVVDFPTEDVLNCDKVIVIPHLGASTEEAEDNCAIMASNQLIDYLENGNILNSVNFPVISKEWTKKYRTVILFTEGCKMLDSLKGEMKVAVKNNVGVAILDTDEDIELSECVNILRVVKLSK